LKVPSRGDMKRRDFITLISGAAAAPVLSPLAAGAQQLALPVIGFLGSRSAEDSTHLVAAFRQGLKEAGFVDGQNVVIEFRWAQGQYDRMPALATELVRREVAVIFASAAPGIRAAKSATTTIPIVFATGGDPVADGFVTSLNRPGGNITGVYLLTAPLEAKRVELLHEVMPNVATIAYLVNPGFSQSEDELSTVQTAAHAVGLQISVLKAGNDADIDTAFAKLAEQRISAVLVAADPFFNGRAEQFVALAARYAVPAMYSQPEFALAGGLMSYGTSLADGYRQSGVYAGRILKGEKPADLPVQQSTKVELVINLRTAKALGISFPIPLLGRADEVIE
jgi:putative ABC transport system substrate-binding protein